MKKIFHHFVLLLAVLCSCSAIAQKKVYVELDTSFHLVADKCNFKEVKIIDDRKDKSRLGSVAAKQFRKGRIILSEQSLDSMLTGFTTNYIKNVPKANATCLIIVRDFNINYATGATPTLYFSGDVFLGENGQYRLAAAIDTLCEFGKSEHKVGVAVSAMMDTILQLVATIPDTAVKGTVFSEVTARKRFADIYKQYPIYTSTPKEGLYNNVKEFLQNEPGITTLHRKDKVNHEGRHRPPITTFYLDEEGERSDKVKKMFAIYDKKEWFVLNREKKIAKMTVKDGDFYRVISLGTTMYSVQSAFGVVDWTIISIPASMILSSDRRHRNGYYETRFNPERKRFMPIAKRSN